MDGGEPSFLTVLALILAPKHNLLPMGNACMGDSMHLCGNSPCPRPRSSSLIAQVTFCSLSGSPPSLVPPDCSNPSHSLMALAKGVEQGWG